MSTLPKSKKKCAIELGTMPCEILCDVYLCFDDIGHQSARLLSSSTRSSSSSAKCSVCKALKHWSVLVCYDDVIGRCEATEEGGKLKSNICMSSKRKEPMYEWMTPKVHLGQYSIEKSRLMTIVGLLDEGEDYNLVKNNCQHWAKKLLKELGIDLDSASFKKELNLIDRYSYKLLGLESI